MLQTCIAALMSISSLSLSGKDRLMVSQRAERHKEKSQDNPKLNPVKGFGTQHSRWEEPRKAGRDRLPLEDLLKDFLRERGLSSGAVSLMPSSIFESSGRSSSERCTAAGAGDVQGDF